MNGSADMYTYESFLRAVAKFPKFCGESNAPLGYDDLDTCRRELAALFAHSAVSSQDWTETDGGPLQLSEDEFESFTSIFFDGAENLDEGYVALSSAMWKYMTTMLPNPSAHSIMTNFYDPNSQDIGAAHYAGFGSTNVVINPSDCNTWSFSEGNNARAEKFNEYAEALGLVAETDNLDCERSW